MHVLNLRVVHMCMFSIEQRDGLCYRVAVSSYYYYIVVSCKYLLLLLSTIHCCVIKKYK